MFFKLARVASTLCFFLCCGCILPAAPTTKDFFKRPDVTGVSVSHDGRYVTYLTPNNDKFYDLNAYDFVKGEPLKYDLKGEDIYSYSWLEQNQLVLSSQKLPIYWSRDAIFDLEKTKFTHNLTYVDLDYEIVSQLSDRPNLFYAFFPAEQRNQPEIAIIDVTRRPKNIGGINNSRFNVVETLLIPKGEFHGCYPDFRGEIRALLLYAQEKRIYHFRASPKAPWIQLPLDPELVRIKAFSDNPDVIYLTRRDLATSTSSLHRYSVSRNEWGPALFSDPDYALDECGLMMSEGNKELLGLRYVRDRTAQISFSPLFKEVMARANQALPAGTKLISDYDEKLTRFIITNFTDRSIRYYIYDQGRHAFSGLPDPYPFLKPDEMRPMQVVHYRTRDGLQLEGYLTLPAGIAESSKPPLVVMPHGGPWARDSWGFSGDVQFLASRGYAVFQPNYRGSTGFPKAISKDGEFAFRQMHDDVTDGVRYLISSGVVDPQHMAIFGASFGGYLALCGAAFEPDLYQCAVTFAGVFDWKQLIAQRQNQSTQDRFNYEFLLTRLGDPEKNRALFEEISPINHIAQIKIPIFVTHGKDDDTVDYAQSKKLLSELQKHHVPVETLFFENERHGFYKLENEVKFYTAVETFLAKYLKPTRDGKN